MLEVLLLVLSHINRLIYLKAFRPPSLWLVPEAEDNQMTKTHFPYRCFPLSRSQSKRWVGETSPAPGLEYFVSRPGGSSKTPPGTSPALCLWPRQSRRHLFSDVSSRKPLHSPWMDPRHGHVFVCWRQSCLQQIELKISALLSPLLSHPFVLSSKPSPHLWGITHSAFSHTGNVEAGVRDHHFFPMENFSQNVVQKGCIHKKENIPPIPAPNYTWHQIPGTRQGACSLTPGTVHTRGIPLILAIMGPLEGIESGFDQSHLQKNRRNNEHSF